MEHPFIVFIVVWCYEIRAIRPSQSGNRGGIICLPTTANACDCQHTIRSIKAFLVLTPEVGFNVFSHFHASSVSLMTGFALWYYVMRGRLQSFSWNWFWFPFLYKGNVSEMKYCWMRSREMIVNSETHWHDYIGYCKKKNTNKNWGETDYSLKYLSFSIKID